MSKWSIESVFVQYILLLITPLLQKYKNEQTSSRLFQRQTVNMHKTIFGVTKPIDTSICGNFNENFL